MIKKRSDDHVRINSHTSTMNCEHCGASEGLDLPLSVQLVVKRTGVFLRKHRKCPAPAPQAAAEPSSTVIRNVVRVTYTEPDLPEGGDNWDRFKASVASAKLEKEARANPRAPAMPRAKPCGSCPYRRDVPAGVWAPEEYAKLPRYDAETFAQPVAPFFCHSQDGTLCAGWLGCADPSELLAVRLGVSSGRLDPSALDYSTDVPLFGSGTEAAEHGASGVKRPSKGAREVIRKLERAKRIKAKRPAR